MKRILLLIDAPTAPLYAPRMRFLITNLSQKGWKWIVVSERMSNTDFEFANCTHFRYAYYSDKPSLQNKIRWLMDKLFDTKERYFYRYVTNHVQPSEIDCILCSSFHTFPLPTAARIAKAWQRPMIADLRDIAEQWGETPYMQHPINTHCNSLNHFLTHLYTQLSIHQRNKALQTAKEVITVSPWHQQVLSRFHSNVHLIYNGYDELTFQPKNVISETFRITYTGKVYDFCLRNPLMLFDALEELKRREKLPKDLKLSFYCEDTIHSQLQSLSEQYNIEPYVDIHSYINNAEIIALLHSTSICLILTRKAEESGPHGIMTTKFFEALGVEKPVLCVPSDEECLAEVIQTTNAGLATTNTEQIKSFILDKYAEWKKNGYTHQPVNLEQKRLFSRQYQAQQFEELLLKAIHEKR